MRDITTYQSRLRVKDLRHAGRNIVSTHECDVVGGYTLWRAEREDKKVITGFALDGVSYRPASEREQARIGKTWVAFTTPCEGAGLNEGLPFLVLATRQVRAARMTTIGGQEAAVHHFAFDGLAGIDDPEARKITDWLRDHRANGETLVVTTGADDGALLALAIRNRSMTTCATPRLYCRSRTDIDGFGRPVGPKPAMPPQDEIYWRPTQPPKHG
jgi:hypothetical protein